ncbi:hypothetical protein BJX99DRAFT_223359 [Aspergillus californicus]
MRHFSLSVTFLLLVLCCTISLSTAWSIPSYPLRKRIPPSLVNKPHARHEQRNLEEFGRIKEWLSNQQPLKGAAMAPPSKGPSAQSASDPIISDVLPKARGINVFASLTRQFESVEGRLNDPSQNVTVLAPRNSAIQELPHKPWENPADYEKFGDMQAYEGDEGQNRARRNLERFVSAHIILESPWKEGVETETLGGDRLRWRKDGDKIYVSSCIACAPAFRKRLSGCQMYADWHDLD